jgi:RNA polymerase-binding transcription factor DksA
MSEPDPTAVPSSPPQEGLLPDLADLDRMEAELADVERALLRLDEGTYGACEVCGEPLADDRLEAEPAGRLCPAHGPGS